MSDESEVLEANQEFYRAFAARDREAMAELWAHASPVACIHPGWPPLIGRDQVLASWRGILENPGAPAVECDAPSVQLLGDAAFVICHEAVGDTRLAATNLFVREAGSWRMVHHQASPIAGDLEISGEGPDASELN